jgi:hypothetical protein
MKKVKNLLQRNSNFSYRPTHHKESGQFLFNALQNCVLLAQALRAFSGIKLFLVIAQLNVS